MVSFEHIRALHIGIGFLVVGDDVVGFQKALGRIVVIFQYRVEVGLDLLQERRRRLGEKVIGIIGLEFAGKNLPVVDAHAQRVFTVKEQFTRYYLSAPDVQHAAD